MFAMKIRFRKIIVQFITIQNIIMFSTKLYFSKNDISDIIYFKWIIFHGNIMI